MNGRIHAGGVVVAVTLAVCGCTIVEEKPDGGSSTGSGSCQLSPQGSANGVTYASFAQGFIEDFCAGCHFPGFTAPNGHSVPNDIPQFTDDTNWAQGGAPRANSIWDQPGGVNYGLVSATMSGSSFPQNTSALPDKIWCGVASSEPSQCACEFPGSFPVPQRFPPSGTVAGKATCPWGTDGMSCPQPSDSDRAQMSDWVHGGTPM